MHQVPTPQAQSNIVYYEKVQKNKKGKTGANASIHKYATIIINYHIFQKNYTCYRPRIKQLVDHGNK